MRLTYLCEMAWYGLFREPHYIVYNYNRTLSQGEPWIYIDNISL